MIHNAEQPKRSRSPELSHTSVPEPLPPEKHTSTPSFRATDHAGVGKPLWGTTPGWSSAPPCCKCCLRLPGLSEASFQQQQILSWHQLILWHQSFHSLTRHVMVFPCHVFSVQNQALTFIFLLRPHGCSFPTHYFYPDPEFEGLLRTIAFDQRFFFNGWLHGDI